jgi:hypothetical protein
MALRVAKAWGLTPAQWRETDVDDRAMMVAFEMFESTTERYREWYARDYFDKKANKKNEGGGGINEFSQMKQSLGLK